MQSVSHMLEQDARFPVSQTREIMHINVCRPTFDFRAQPSNVLTPSLRCLSVRTLKTPSAFSFNGKLRATSPAHFYACQTIHNRRRTFIWFDIP
jgi:hypothetical protein